MAPMLPTVHLIIILFIDQENGSKRSVYDCTVRIGLCVRSVGIKI